MTLVFVALVAIGFGFWMAAAYGAPWAERVARTLFFVASLVWALGVLK